jgi:SAM-dependent methyltransferase
MNPVEHQHPPTYISTGDPIKDFKYAFEAYDSDIGSYLPEDKNAAILDVGCGWGQCLLWMKLKGYSNLLGIDVGADQEAHGSAIGIDVRRVDDPSKFLESHAGEFDLVVMNHVIEHVPAHEGIKILQSIFKALRTGGRIIVQTPNMNSIGANAGRYIEISHVTGYTDTSLQQLVGLAGFQDIEAFGNKTKVLLKPRRLAWFGLQKVSRMIWKIMLFSELGSDSPTVIEKNLYVTATKGNKSTK